MEAHDEIAMKKPIWPHDAPIPSFDSYADELAFWHSYDFDSDQPQDGWEAVPRANKRAAVLTVDDELAEKSPSNVVVYLPNPVHAPKTTARLPKSFPLTVTLDRRALKKLVKVAEQNGTSVEGALGRIVQTAINDSVSTNVAPSARPRTRRKVAR